MKWHGVFLSIVFIQACMLTPRILFAQSGDTDSNFYHSAVSAAIDLYHRSTGDQSGLYNGALYSGYPFRFKSGTPFFYSDAPESGSILYDGILYENLQLRYDNLKLAVMIKDNGYEIQLNNRKIESFSLHGHQLLHPADNDVNDGGISTGFYEILYAGNISLYKKTIKNIQEDLSSGQVVEHEILQQDHYYVKKDSTVYPVEGRKDFTALFPARKKELQQFIKRDKLNFNKDIENALLKLVVYCEQTRK
jgi:hypothetical protein